MALNLRNLAQIGAPGFSTAARHWAYKTQDAVGTSAGNLGGANYWNGAASLLSLGDRIHYTVVTNMGASNEAVTHAGIYVVMTISAAGVVAVSPANALTLS